MISIEIASMIFVRSDKDEFLLCNLHNGSAVVLGCEADFLRPMIAGVNLEVAAQVLSEKYNVPHRSVLRDMMVVYQELSNLKLIQQPPKHGNISPFSYEPIDLIAANKASEIEGWPVAEFYKNHNLMSEIHVDLTDCCTERCVHCYIPQGQCDYLPYPLVEKVLREFREQQGLTVQLSGGECMVHPDFTKICRLCRELDLNFIVLSNLTLCDEEMISVLKETDPQFVNVSLYSMKAEEHDAITQIRGSWKKTMTAIDACQAAGIHIRLATPLLKVNQHAYPALRKFAAERHVHLIPDCEIIPRCDGDCSNLDYACSPTEAEAALREDKAFWNRGYGRSNPRPDDRVCDVGKLLCVNSKGEYYPCSGMHGYILGNARKNILTEIWEGEKIEYLRTLKNKDFPKCVNCEHRAFCKVCPAFNFNASGSLFEPIPAKCALAEVKHRVFGGE